MARIRSIKPEFWTSEQVMKLSRDARLLFIGLWNFCDDNGIHRAAAISLKAEVFPGDQLDGDQVMAMIDEMIEQDLVEEYEANGQQYWRVTGWKSHQRIDQPTYRHPTSDAGDKRGDAGDTGDANKKRVTCVTPRRLGGKQRQIVLKKLRHRDGDACHLCGDSSSLGIFSSADGGEENPNDINLLRLICSGCKRKNKPGDAKKTGGDAQIPEGDAEKFDGDSRVTHQGSGVEWSGGFTEGTGKIKNSDSDDATVPDYANQQNVVSSSSGEAELRAKAIAWWMNTEGIEKATSLEPNVVAWSQNPRVTDSVLETALISARKTKGAAKIFPLYLTRIIDEMLAQPAPVASAAPAAPRTPTGTEPKGIDESIDAYETRIANALAKRQGQTA